MAMPSLVIDPSIALKCLLPETDSEAALTVLDRAAVSAPEWLAAECAEVLAVRVKAGELPRETAAAALADLELMPIVWVRDATLTAKAFDIACEIDRPIQDCLYLALAVERTLQLLTSCSSASPSGTNSPPSRPVPGLGERPVETVPGPPRAGAARRAAG